MEVTPFLAQVSISESLILREALLMSGSSTPTPAQNSLKPPPVPVDSTTGVLNLPALPNCSATAVEKGNTVLEPTMRIWSRACAWPASASIATAASAMVYFIDCLLMELLVCDPGRDGLPCAHAAGPPMPAGEPTLAAIAKRIVTYL